MSALPRRAFSNHNVATVELLCIHFVKYTENHFRPLFASSSLYPTELQQC